eukprot:scaffold721_cov327-Prasinococcus_capsulatus_cf.AAC.2
MCATQLSVWEESTSIAWHHSGQQTTRTTLTSLECSRWLLRKASITRKVCACKSDKLRSNGVAARALNGRKSD